MTVWVKRLTSCQDQGQGPRHNCTSTSQHLRPALHDDTLLVTDDNAAYRYFAAEPGITHESVNLSQDVRVRGAFHVQNINAYHCRLRQ